MIPAVWIVAIRGTTFAESRSALAMGTSRPTAATAAQKTSAPMVRAGTRQAQLIAMLRAPDGATLDEIAAATGWQPHTVRGAIAGALKEVTSEKVDARGRVRRLPAA